MAGRYSLERELGRGADRELVHPHVVPIHAVEEQGGGDLVFFVMPFVDGETVGQRVRRAGPLPSQDLLRLHAGTGTPGELTRNLERARNVALEVDRMVEGRKEAELG